MKKGKEPTSWFHLNENSIKQMVSGAFAYIIGWKYIIIGSGFLKN